MGTRLRRVSDRTFNDNEASAIKDKRYLSAKRTRIATGRSRAIFEKEGVGRVVLTAVSAVPGAEKMIQVTVFLLPCYASRMGASGDGISFLVSGGDKNSVHGAVTVGFRSLNAMESLAEASYGDRVSKWEHSRAMHMPVLECAPETTSRSK